MNKTLSFLLVIPSLFFGCSKSNNNSVTPIVNHKPVVKIQLVSGGEQTDTIGNPLINPVIVKVTADGVATSGYSVQFRGSGCNVDNIVSTLTQPDGTAGSTWSLSGDVGQQSMKIYVLDSNNQKIDSVTATATGLPSGSGWHSGGCSLQQGNSPTTLCKLSTGRIFTCYGYAKTYLRYSDDNGVNWNAVKSLGNSHEIAYVISTPADEVFAFTTNNEGTFYSNDGGQSWSNVGTPPFDPRFISGTDVTSDGKILVTTLTLPPLYISSDKGKTWTTISNNAFTPVNNVSPHFYWPTEDNDGNLYVIEAQNGNLFKSADGGANWNLVPEGGTTHPGTDIAFYVDQNNWFYKGVTSLGSGIYLSKDKGLSYTMLIQGDPTVEFGNMSVQSDGNFYYEDIGRGLYKYNPNSKISELLFGFSSTGIQAYIVAKNNNLIIVNAGKPYIKYYTK